MANCLIATLNPQTQKSGNLCVSGLYIYILLAERQLISFESSIPNFPLILLSLCVSEKNSRDGLPFNVDIPSALLLKNIIKKHWTV